MHETAGVDFNISPVGVIWENTRACDLACRHCRAAAQPKRNQFELTTEEGFRLIDEIAAMRPKSFVITGGDPLKRDDTFEMIRHAKGRGLQPSIAPSATPRLTEEAIEYMKAYGLSRMAVSLDASSAALHDDFRRVPGSFDITLRAIRAAKRVGITVQVNTTVTRRTIADLPRLVETLQDLGIVMWSVASFVPTGLAKRADLEEVEELFGFLYHTSKRVPFSIRTPAAMHYRRYMLQRMSAEHGPRPMPLGIQPGAVSRAPRGANEAKGFVFISHIGDVSPSGFLPQKAGNVKQQPLGEIYRSSKLFTSPSDPLCTYVPAA